MHKDFNGGMVTHYIKTIIFYKFENEFYPINIYIYIYIYIIRTIVRQHSHEDLYDETAL